jgi:hypothetical protein
MLGDDEGDGSAGGLGGRLRRKVAKKAGTKTAKHLLENQVAAQFDPAMLLAALGLSGVTLGGVLAGAVDPVLLLTAVPYDALPFGEPLQELLVGDPGELSAERARNVLAAVAFAVGAVARLTVGLLLRALL